MSSTRYRHTLVAAAGARARYAVSVFEVRGGLQHDQLYHGPAGSNGRWQTAVETKSGPASLLPVTVSYVPQARAQDGRWFVQAYGAFSQLSHARADRSTQAWLMSAGSGAAQVGIRLHLLNEEPRSLYTGLSPDPTPPPVSAVDAGRPVLLVRRRSDDGSSLLTTFVTLFEPIGPLPALKKVARVSSPADTVVVQVETDEGREYLVINLRPGTVQTVHLVDGQAIKTDGLAVRVRSDGLVLAGGTFVEAGSLTVRQTQAAGTISAVSRQTSPDSRGWFEAESPVSDLHTLAGRVLLIRHGDGTTRGWTIARAEATADGRARFHVREEPGFLIDPTTRVSHYYQFPRNSAAGPHRFRVAKLAR
jgi:hypothetical protein